VWLSEFVYPGDAFTRSAAAWKIGLELRRLLLHFSRDIARSLPQASPHKFIPIFRFAMQRNP
jgi:hypothetical protein